MIDVYLLSGFLGSGKTSLLLHLLNDVRQQGKKPAVFMNEFGQLGFDSQLVEKEGNVPLKEMLDGCICCSGREQTEAQLQALLMEEQDIDMIFIETTGAAHPVDALDAVHSPLFAEQLRVAGIVTVVDGMRWLDRDRLPPQMRSLFLEQIRHAHVLLLNKVDQLTEQEIASVSMQLQQFNAHAAILQTSHAKLAFSDLQKMIHRPDSHSEKQIVHTKHLPLSSRVIRIPVPVDQETVEAWIATLPDTVYRIKGYIPIKGSKYPYLFQYAYGIVHWLPEYMKMDPVVVLIGEDVENVDISLLERGMPSS